MGSSIDSVFEYTLRWEFAIVGEFDAWTLKREVNSIRLARVAIGPAHRPW